MTNNDPVVERLDDALERAQQLEQRALRGEAIPNVEIVSEMRAVRVDLLAERRDVLIKRAEYEKRFKELDDKKLNRSPNAVRAVWLFATTVMTVIGGFTLWLVTVE